MKNVQSKKEHNLRQNWSEAFQEMAKNGDDQLVIPDVFEDEDLEDWTWEETKRI